MDLLLTAVADVALLIATARALRTPATPAAEDAPDLRGLRRLRGELRRAAGTYLKTLLRSEESMAAKDALAACRVAAEQRMPKAIAAAETLSALMTGESGALEGFASARNDLWRLARVAVSLRDTTARREEGDREAKTRRKSAKQLAKRLRRALVGYVRAAVRSDGSTGTAIAEARRAALDQLGLASGVAGDKAAGSTAPTSRSFGAGVSRGLDDLLADWSDAGQAAGKEAKAGPAHLSQPTISLDLTFGRIIRRLSRRTERQIRRLT